MVNRLKAILQHLQRLPFEVFILIVVLAAALLSSPLTKLLMILITFLADRGMQPPRWLPVAKARMQGGQPATTALTHASDTA
jgi:hypothetical protein